MRPHYLHIYEKPRIGNQFIKRYEASRYNHRIVAMGGFDTASCELALPQDEAETFLWSHIGNRVAVYGENPALPIWEGIINRISLDTGTVQFTRSIDEMANRVLVLYADDSGTKRIKRTSGVVNAKSTQTYGFKSTVYDIGEQYTDGSGISTETRDRILNDVGLPVVSAVSSTSNRQTLSIQMIGMYQTIAWDTENVSNNTLVTEQNVIRSFINGTGTVPSYSGRNSSRFGANGDGVFFDDTDLSWLNGLPTSSFNKTYEIDLGTTYWDFIRGIVEAGNNGRRMICGITRTNPNTGTRIFYYQLVNTAVDYITDAYGSGDIYTITGQYVPPAEVEANRVIRVNSSLMNNDTTFYIKEVEYDAERNQATWTTDEDFSLRSIFAINQGAVSTAKRFGHVRQVDWSR